MKSQFTPKLTLITRGSRHAAAVSLAVLALVGWSAGAQAQVAQIKAAGATALTTGSSWVSGTIPTSTGIAVWNNVATATGDTITTLGGAFSIGGIQLSNNVAGAVGITDTTVGDILTLNGIPGTGLGIDLSLANQNLTLSAPITIGGNQTWNIGSARTLTLSGVNSDLTLGANVVTVTGGGTVDLNFPNLPNTASSSSAGAGLVINGSTVFATIQEPVSTFHNNVNYLGANTVLTMTPSSTTASTYELGEVASSGSAKQNFAGLVLNAGTSIFTASGRTSSSGHSVGFAAITRNGGALADFINNGGTFGAAANAYALPQPATGPDAGMALALGFGTASANDWAEPKGATTTFSAVTYTADTFTAGLDDNVVLTNDTASAGTVNSLRFNTASNSVLTLAGANLITSGGILVGSTVGTHNTTITGGTLTSGNVNADGTSDLILINNTASSGNVIVSSVLTDNGAQPVGLTVGATSATTPTGSVELGGANTFSGTTYVTKGRLLLLNSLALQNSTFNTTLPGTLNFGTLTAATLGGLSGSGSLALPNNFALTVGGSQNSTLNGALSGVGASVTKVGGGTLTFNAANKYTGNTTISAGTLALGAAGVYGGTAVINSGATLDVSAAGNYLLAAGVSGNGAVNGNLTVATGGQLSPSGTTGVLTMNNSLTLSGGTLLINVDAGMAANGVINIGAGGAGNLSLVSGSIQLNITDGALANGTYKLIGVPNGTITGVGNISVAGFAQANQVATLAAGAGALNLVVSSYTFQHLTWVGDGAGSGLWNVAGDADWFDNTSSSAAGFNTGDYVTFDSTSPNETVNLASAFVSPSSVTVNSASYTFTGNGAISGSASLTDASSGLLTILTTNNYIGGTTINGGGSVQVGNGTVGGAIGSGPVTDNGSLAWNLPSGTETMGAASGSGSLTLSGTGTLVLNGADSLAGTTTVTSGTLKQSAPNLLPNGGGQGNLAVNGTLDLGGQSAAVNGLSGSGTINSSAVGVPTLTVLGGGAFGGLVENTVGTLALNVNGAGQSLLLSHANTYSGGTTITAGTLQLGNAAALGSGSDLTVATGAVLDIYSNSPSVGALIGGGMVNDTGPGTNTLTIGVDNNNGTFSGMIENTVGVVNLTMNGSGTETLAGVSSIGGNTTVSAGTLVLPAGGALTCGLIGGEGFQVTGGSLILTNPGTSTFNLDTGHDFLETAGTVTNAGVFSGGSGDGAFIEITGGSFSAAGVTLQRTANIANATAAAPEMAPATSGLYINGANASVNLGALSIGTGNSAAQARLDAGSLTVSNEVEIGIGNGRWSSLMINGGVFTNLDTVNGLVIAQNASAGEAYFTNGSTSFVQKISFGLASDSAAGGAPEGFLDVFGNANLYIGAGGISKLNSHMTTANYGVELNSGTLGAIANSTIGVSMSLSGTSFNFQAADPAGNPWTMTINGSLSGPGVFVATGTGTVILGGANTYTGGTTISNGIVSFVSGALTGTGGGVNLSGGTLQWQPGASDDISALGLNWPSQGTLDVNGNTVILANPIGNGAGAGTLTVASTAPNGVLSLTGANSYPGNTVVASGTLAANSSSATGTGTVTVQSGATLAGTGTAGTVEIVSGGILSPGNSTIGVLTVGSLTMDSGAVCDIEFNGSTNDQVAATSLSLQNSVFNLYTAGGTQPWTTAGTYTLFTYSGADPVLDSTWTTSSGGNPHIGNASPISTYAFAAGNGKLTLTITENPNLNVATWTSAASGNWSSGPNWSTNPKVPNAAGDTATFGVGTGSGLTTVTLDAAESVGGMTFTNNNPFDIAASATPNTLTLNNGGAGASIYVLAGTGNTIATPMALADNTTVSVDIGDSLILSGTIANSPSVTKTLALTGAGTTIISGANSYGPAAGATGTTLSGGGTLQVAGGSALGAGNVSVTASSTLQAGASVSLNNKIATSTGVNLTVDNDANTFALAGAISGSGTLTEIGTGTLTLSGNNTYTGVTVVSNGVLSLSGSASVAGTPSIDLIAGDLLGNGALSITPKIGIGSTVLADIGTYTGLIDAASGSVFTLSGVIASDGNTGTQNLEVNSRTGSTGTVILGGANTFGAVTGAGAGLAQVYNGLLEVASSLALQNCTLDYNSYGGSLAFAAGLTNATLGGLQGGQNLTLTNLAGAGVALNVSGNDTPTAYSGNLTDNGQGGSLTKLGLQPLTLTGNSSFSGITVSAGQVDLQGSLTCGQVNTLGNGGAQLLVDGGSTLVVTNGTNICTIGTGSTGLLVQGGTATFSGALGEPLGNDANALIQASSGFLSVSNIELGRSGTVYTTQPTTGDTGSGLYVNGGNVLVTNNLDMGVGAAALSTVSVRVDGGNLTVGNTLTIGLSNLGRWSVVDVNGGTLTVTNSATGIAVGGPLAGNAELLVQNGMVLAGTITMGQGNVTNLGEIAVVNVTGGALYPGSGGIVQAPSGAGYVTSEIQLGGGMLAAATNWSTAVPVQLTGSFGATYNAISTADASGNPWNITLTGGISGSGPLYVNGGTGVLTISGVETWTGGTLVSQGTLALVGQDSAAGFLQDTLGVTNNIPGVVDATGLADQTLHVGDATIKQVAQTLSGNGLIKGSVYIGAVGTLAPGLPTNSVYAFYQLPINSNLTVTNGGRVVLNVDDQGSGGVNDSVNAASVVFRAGSSLALYQGNNDLKAGDTFQLFNITGHTGLSSATNLVLTLPALSPDSLYTYVWNTSQLAVNGSVTLASVNPAPVAITSSVAGGMLTLSWPAQVQGWILQTNSVDLANPNDWYAVPGSTGTTTESFTIDPTQTEVFFRLVQP